MNVFFTIMATVLSMLGMETEPKVVEIDHGLAFYASWTDTVSYNSKDYPCEKNVPLCAVAIAHEVGGHRYAALNNVTPNNEEFAYLQAITITAQLTDNMLLSDTPVAVRANEIAYEYWRNWHRQYSKVCHDSNNQNGPFLAC